MIHPKMLRRILSVASERLTPGDRHGFIMYFELLKEENDKARLGEKRRPEELLLEVLTAYLPTPWRRIAKHRSHSTW
jgi:hypothetical protein